MTKPPATNSVDVENVGLRVTSDEINFLVYRYLQESGVSKVTQSCGFYVIINKSRFSNNI